MILVIAFLVFLVIIGLLGIAAVGLGVRFFFFFLEDGDIVSAVGFCLVSWACAAICFLLVAAAASYQPVQVKNFQSKKGLEMIKLILAPFAMAFGMFLCAVFDFALGVSYPNITVLCIHSIVVFSVAGVLYDLLIIGKSKVVTEHNDNSLQKSD